MLAGILFLVLVLAVAVLITVDVVRMPNEAPAGLPDQHARAGERAFAGARGGNGANGVQAFSREPVRREQSVPAVGARIAADPAELGSFGQPDQTARIFGQTRRDVPVPAAGDSALHGKSNAMFVNLSRRSQAMVERQIRLIESLEHGEQDRQRLASLSRLNRIAMRIHRNSQNLLVLAGQEPATGWSQPVTLAHLVEAALAEVEDNERVSFEVQPDIAMRGPAVHDAVHLLVELIDNATSFSAADMPVHVEAHVLTTGGALVSITDRGIGMAADEMAYANRQLDNPPPPDIDIPKWMGLLVVARLAARHGIRVRLNQADFGGLTALVWLPDEILTHYSAADPGRPAAAPPEPAWPVPSPQPAGQATARRLPIFDEIESRWTREAPGPAGLAAAPQAGGLSRRPPAGTQAFRTVPGPPPSGASVRPGGDRDALTGLPRRSAQGRAPAPAEGSPGGSDES